MIPRVFVYRTLMRLDKLYQESSTSGDIFLPKLYSKLAVIELCGWTEECMDNVMFLYIKKNRIREKDNISYINEEVIKKNWGFSYDRHFRKMLFQVVGVVKLERLEKYVDQGRKGALIAALAKLRPERDSHAHETIRTAKNFTAPSVCISLFKDISEGLMEYETILKKV